MLAGFKSVDVFMLLMILGISVTAVGVTIVLYQIWASERNKADTLSLYAYLRMDRIKKVYDKCDEYLEILIEGKTGIPSREKSPIEDESLKA